MRISVDPGCSQPYLQTVQLKVKFRSMDDEEWKTELYLDEALLGG